MAGAGWKVPQVGLRTAARGGGGFLELRSIVEAVSRVVFSTDTITREKDETTTTPRKKITRYAVCYSYSYGYRMPGAVKKYDV